jgi:amidase
MASEELCDRPAVELARMMRDREVSVREVLDAHLERIDRWNPAVNAIVTRTTDLALARAADLDEALARDEEPGPLHGLPIAHKDLVDTAGIRTTYGSPIYADHVPDVDEPFVARLRAAGTVLVGKTNTPEFGAGSHTFNPVFGPTRNPYDLARSAGGSSGGAAAALATGMVPVADGSDLGGSLRNPASFCNVVGFRPSLDDPDPRELSVDGPMARTVADVALLWSVMSGAPRRSVEGDVAGRRIAWSPSCGGRFPVDPAVVAAVDAARPSFESLGCPTVESSPDLDASREVFLTLRARSFAESYEELLAEHRDEMKATVVWNIEQGLALDDAAVGAAVDRMHGIRGTAERFFATVDYLVQPVSQLPPFPIELEYPTEVAGEAMSTYVDWMASCWSVTVLGGPAISMPCGFTEDGLPIGLQIVGRAGDDVGVLRLAHAFEQTSAVGRVRPVMAPAPGPRPPAM